MGLNWRKMLGRLGATHLGRVALSVVAVERPDLLAGALGYFQAREARIHLSAWPEHRPTFDELAPLLLTSSAANRGLASMRLDEIAYLWRAAAAVGEGTLVEIGRERGGSTIALASAMSNKATLWSYDPQTKLGDDNLDRELAALLARIGAAAQVHLITEDSHVADLPPGEYGLVLIDGDPTIEGTRADFERFAQRLRAGGLVLFHDATPGAPRATQLAQLIAEIGLHPDFTRQPDVGTFVIFARN